jgi:hypothetical protein
MTVAHNLTKSDCCSTNKDNSFKFIDDGVSNVSGNISIDLSDILMNRCNTYCGIIDLKPQEIKNISAALIVLSSKNTEFLVTDNQEYKSNNSILDITYESIVDGNVENFSINVSFTNNLEESLYNFSNFHNKPYNHLIENINDIIHSWDFYSTSNSTTSTEIIQNYISDVLELQVIDGSDTEKIYLFVADNGNKLYVTLKYSNGNITVENILIVGGLTVDEISIVNTNISSGESNYEIFFRNIRIYQIIDSIFMSNYNSLKEITIYNHNDTNIKIKTLYGNLCEDETLDTECCC